MTLAETPIPFVLERFHMLPKENNHIFQKQPKNISRNQAINFQMAYRYLFDETFLQQVVLTCCKSSCTNSPHLILLNI